MMGSRGRVIIKCAFGKLKGQWRCLLYGLRTRDVILWKETVTTCCILHNISIQVSGQGWKMTGVFLQPAREPECYRQDPDRNMNPWHWNDRILDDSTAKGWRDCLLDDMRQKW
eukprot:FR739867.1.p2 GENE.FR739867.1~~FR739867.1.p2  ORF type:complete len:113 (-),score=10.05 FR739867.1:12-350(-)